jgi:hypothetical protein
MQSNHKDAETDTSSRRTNLLERDIPLWLVTFLRFLHDLLSVVSIQDLSELAEWLMAMGPW